jgi:Dyp-type peroxidase family
MSAAARDGGVAMPLDMDDIQSGALHHRPSPYVGGVLLLRIDDPQAGRDMLRRLLPAIASGLPSTDATQDAWVSVAFSHAGLQALGVSEETLASFPLAFQQGMAARAAHLGDVGESDPAQWEPPFGSTELHVMVSGLAPDDARLEQALAQARPAYENLPGVRIIWRQEVRQLATGRTTFGFRDGISYPAIEGSGIPGSNPQEPPIKAGEFILGYPDETGNVPPMPQPEVLGRNGTYVAIRKLQTDVAGWRRFLRANTESPEEEARLAAKMMGRWPSGAPLALAPDEDDPDLGVDYHRNNDFLYREDDPRGFKCPAGAHIRRVNPRDAEIIGVTRLHRILRRGLTYGPPLPDGALDDDGIDRGLLIAFIGAQLERQFEFIKREWVNDGNFAGYPGESDPVAGQGHGAGMFTIPAQPIRRRIQAMPNFVATRGGEYLFLPGLRALRWLAEQDG